MSEGDIQGEVPGKDTHFRWREADAWRPLLATALTGRSSDARVLEALQSEYPGLIAHHGCRPRSVDSYYRDGIRLPDLERLDGEARSIFLTGNFPELTLATLDRAIGELRGVEPNSIYLAVDDRHLLERAGHYLIYGSERVTGIAAELSKNGYDYRQFLKNFGRPTILEVAIPWDAVPESTAKNFARAVREQLRLVRQGEAPEIRDFTVTLRRMIPPEWIVSHHYPLVIIDWLDDMKEYRAPVSD